MISDLQLTGRACGPKHTPSLSGGVGRTQFDFGGLKIRSYDVILMDIQMPEMDGLETTRVIRQQWRDRSIKIIAVTSCNQKGDR